MAQEIIFNQTGFKPSIMVDELPLGEFFVGKISQDRGLFYMDGARRLTRLDDPKDSYWNNPSGFKIDEYQPLSKVTITAEV